MSRKIQRDSNEKTNCIMLMREIPAAACDNHTAQICTMWGVNAKFLNVTATALKF